MSKRVTEGPSWERLTTLIQPLIKWWFCGAWARLTFVLRLDADHSFNEYFPACYVAATTADTETKQVSVFMELVS